jgi:hypothetical protein
MKRRIRGALVALLLLGGFFACWLATFTENEYWSSAIAWVTWSLLSIGIAAGAVRRLRSDRNRQPERSQDLAPLDPVQAVYQGRTTPTFAGESADASSQITGPPSLDPLVLPTGPKRRDRP